MTTDPFGNPCTSRRHREAELVEPDPTRTCPRCGTTWTAEVDACPNCPTVCCDLHNQHCEPPSEMCCHQCTESEHPYHLDGRPCVLEAK